MFVCIEYLLSFLLAHSPDLPDDKGNSQKSSGQHRNSDEVENDANVSWKKLSSSSKMRNYRDDKYKESDLLYKERPLKADPYSQRKSSHNDISDSRRNSKYDRSRDSERRREDVVSRGKDKSSSNKSQHKSSSKTDTKSNKDNGHRSRNRRVSPELETKSSKDSKSHRHHHKRKHSEDDRHHHRHHHSSKSNEDKQSHKMTSSSTMKTESTAVKPSTSNYQAYPVIKSFDSKEIYSEGILYKVQSLLIINIFFYI